VEGKRERGRGRRSLLELLPWGGDKGAREKRTEEKKKCNFPRTYA
jgi:hypothetical protein